MDNESVLCLITGLGLIFITVIVYTFSKGNVTATSVTGEVIKSSPTGLMWGYMIIGLFLVVLSVIRFKWEEK